MTDIEWACKWAGWIFAEGLIYEDCQRGSLNRQEPRSLADLAEAVRVKFLETKPQNFPGEVMWELMRIMMYEGPLALIKAVREVIDNG